MTWIDAEENDRSRPAGTRNVKTVARIRCNGTGEVREYDMTAWLEPDAEAPSDFIWADGNFACDCNRKIFFGRAIGFEYEDEDTPCGDSAYSVQMVNPADGSVWYDEFAANPNAGQD